MHKIAFLCSSLEPSRDGVGDYTRLLAQECQKRGAACRLLALQDRWADASEASANAGEGERSILRLPARLPWQQRLGLAQNFLDEFAPDWLSLQFVPYAFHPKGIVRGLEQPLRKLAGSRKSHVMFHELWIGAEQGAPVKERLVGALQRQAIQKLTRTLKPALIHTSNATYVARLKQQGIAAGELPLFGNIPVWKGEGTEQWLLSCLQEKGLKIDAASRDRYWLFGFFGALFPIWPPEPLFGLLEQAARRTGRKVVFCSLGKIGAGEALWETLAARYGERFSFVRMGIQPEERISQFLQTIDYGISATPYSLLGKSGTTVAMLEHGVPVIVNRDDVQYRAIRSLSPDPLILKMEEGLEERLVRGVAHTCAAARLPSITEKFLKDLQKTADGHRP